MSRYVLIESRDPFESRDVQFVVDAAIGLKRRGNDVTVFLVQNGVLAARKNARVSHLPLTTEIVAVASQPRSETISSKGVPEGSFAF